MESVGVVIDRYLRNTTGRKKSRAVHFAICHTLIDLSIHNLVRNMSKRHWMRQFIKDIGSMEDSKYINTIDKIVISKTTGTISVDTGIIISNRTLKNMHKIGVLNI